MDIGIPGCVEAEFIGRGGYGSVYRCHQPALNRKVAVKIFSLSRAETDDIVAFERECAAIGQLDWCPNIVTVFQAGRNEVGKPYIIMEYAPGQSLADRIKESGGLAESAVRRIGERIASALAVAHGAGILHRDVKPANILVSRTGEPLLADFGIAKLAGGISHTSTGSIVGSVGFCAPEVLEGGTATEQSDIYSLGASLYTMLAGRAPFAKTGSDTLTEMIVRTLTAPLPSLAGLHISDDLARVIERAMSRKPSERYADASEMAEELRDKTKAGSDGGKTRWAPEFYATDRPGSLPTAMPSGPWPTAIDYVNAVQTQAAPVPSPGFGSARLVRDSLGMPSSASGQTAVVFELSSSLGPLALRCFTRDAGDGAIRYRALGEHLAKHRCEPIAPALWVESALEVRGQRWPTVVMPWVPGVPLNIAVEDMLDRPDALRALAGAWVDCVAELANSGLAHGDLQSGNVLVDSSGGILLVDLDGVYVPSLTVPPDEYGHPNFQHPRRSSDTWGPQMDAFSMVVIALSLRALAADPQLWTFNSGENLVFSRDDYLAPGSTAVWRAVNSSSDAQVVQLAGLLREYCANPQPPTLDSALEAFGIARPAWMSTPPPSDEIHEPTRRRGDIVSDYGASFDETELRHPRVKSDGVGLDQGEPWWFDSRMNTAPAKRTVPPEWTPSTMDNAPVSGGTRSGQGFARFIIRNSALTGLYAGLITAIVSMWLFALASPGPHLRALLLLTSIGALAAGTLASLPRFALRSWVSASASLLAGAVLGAGLSSVSLAAFDSLFTFHRGPAPISDLVFAWGGAGLAIGLAAGLARFNTRAIAGGALGGLAGGILGGLIYATSSPKFIPWGTHGGLLLDVRLSASMATALLGACAVIGISVGTADRLSRRAWLTVIEGPMRGSEITLDRRTALVGAAPSDTLRLTKDPGVLASHLTIYLAGDPRILTRGDIEVNGTYHAAGSEVAVASGDVIRIGGSFVRYRARSSR
jgi:serine/threonine protein kinase